METLTKNTYTRAAVVTVLWCVLVGCAGKELRTFETDSALRVAINPQYVEPVVYMAVQDALLRSKAFIILDRGPSMQAIDTERDDQWRAHPDKYEPSTKYAVAGHTIGAGSMVTPTVRCIITGSMWRAKKSCMQALAITSTRTGEVIASASSTKVSDPSELNMWDELVEKLVLGYPEVFTSYARKGTREIEEKEILMKQMVLQKEQIEKIDKEIDEWTKDE